MKRLPLILSVALMMSAPFVYTSCEETDLNIINNNDDAEEDTPGAIENFSVSLNYNSEDASAKGAFDAETGNAVAYSSSSADVCLCWQNNYGYIISQPDGYELKQLFGINKVKYNNTNTCTIQNLGNVNINEYKDKETLSRLSVSSGSIPNLQGKNQVQVEAGDVIAFKTSSGAKGVGKISSLSKVKKSVTFSGVVYYPSSASR